MKGIAEGGAGLRRGWNVRPTAIALVLLAFYGILRYGVPAWDVEWVAPDVYFRVVTSVALLATVLGAAVGVAGDRLRNLKVIFVGLAFLSLVGLVTLHALSSSGVWVPASRAPVAVTLGSVLAASFWLWLSGLPADHPVVAAFGKWKSALVPIWAVVLFAFVMTGVWFPRVLDRIPADHPLVEGAVTAVGLAFTVAAGWSYERSYRFFRFPIQRAMATGCYCLAVLQIVMVTSQQWRLSWWMSHLLLLAFLIVAVIGIVRQYGHEKSLTNALRALFAADPFRRVSDGLSPYVQNLVEETERRDPHIAGHNYRVAVYALRLAEEMGLEREKLRALGQGALVHDVGKMDVPEHILNKKGPLTPEERAVIERHPVTGYDLCKQLGFMREELEVIRHHHERWDGTGYPDGLSGEDIPLLARIAAVADVYDALTSDRSYRPAWRPEQAMEYLKQERGKQFDPQCVDAWFRMCARDPDFGEPAPRQARNVSTSRSGTVGNAGG
ncbi:MAG: hypothetical protein BLM47_04690 [Candidatus Reconcilbacillus cellulovorans]|uniref:HD-GYP domain-containing protein n=1 Tax=Candidatus Reconcilbacillus cellulovorans TaxID=1906605 RepID=A0A2A6E2D1_9BACL|nr:MAG: hypothetical protein BLM47_04690 [Candidatus Reconcilbacillus cellulovorans]